MASAIPSEIVELVLAHIRQDDVSEDTRNLITAMCVCRQWCELGIRVIWADIAITSLTQLGSFVKAPLSTNFSLVRSLSLVLPPCEPKLALDNNGRWYYAEGVCHIFEHGNCRTQELHGHVSRLVDFLPHMINLEAFSFHITGCIGMGHRPNGFFINQDVLRQLLEALPKSLQHLELDTKMYDRSNKSDKSDHLCPTISIISQRLQTLRVRLSQACSAIFGDSQTLNTCVFNLTNPEGVTLVHECANAGVWGLVREVTGHATRRVLIGAAVENSPRCPKLQNLLFTDSTLRSVNQNNSPDVSSLTVRNVLNTTSSAFPLFPVETHNSVANSDRSVLRFKMANGPAWHTTAAGARFPAVFKESIRGRSVEWSDLEAWFGREEFKISAGQVHLWGEEDQAGRQIVHVRETDGLDEDSPLMKDQWKNEKQLVQEAKRVEEQIRAQARADAYLQELMEEEYGDDDEIENDENDA